MKRSFLIAVIFTLGIGLQLGSCHPPDSLVFGLDSTRTLISVKSFHPVKDPSTHYITTVTIELNRKKIITQSFKSQTDNAVQIAEYRIIDAKPGDKLQATAQCNIAGKKKAAFVVPDN